MDKNLAALPYLFYQASDIGSSSQATDVVKFVSADIIIAEASSTQKMAYCYKTWG